MLNLLVYYEPSFLAQRAKIAAENLHGMHGEEDTATEYRSPGCRP
jgi:hypothetical protein